MPCEARGAGGGSLWPGTSIATANVPNNDSAPLVSHIVAQLTPAPSCAATSAAETVMPAPTPAKCSAIRPGRPASANRSSTSAEARISASALTTPPTNRKTMKPAIDVVRPIAAVVTALANSAPSSQARREPGSVAFVAPSAPARYPAKFAEAISPAVDLLKPSVANIDGRIGV